MHDSEIRRIDEDQAAAVTELWDRMCRETPDGGPLTARGRRNITRMLQIASWHHETCCLVATTGTDDTDDTDGTDGTDVIGFVVARLDAGDGLAAGSDRRDSRVCTSYPRRSTVLSCSGRWPGRRSTGCASVAPARSANRSTPTTRS